MPLKLAHSRKPEQQGPCYFKSKIEIRSSLKKHKTMIFITVFYPSLQVSNDSLIIMIITACKEKEKTPFLQVNPYVIHTLNSYNLFRSFNSYDLPIFL